MPVEAEDHVEDVERDDAHLDQEREGEQQDTEWQEPDPVEALARKMGWRPKDELRDPNTDYRSPEDFILASREISRRHASDVRDLREQVSRMARTSAAIVENNIRARRAALDTQLEEAVEAQDTDAVRRIQREQGTLAAEARDARPAPVKPQATVDFEERNATWLGKNKAATALAVAECERLAKDGIVDPEAQLEIAERAVKQRFPELFEQRGARREERQEQRRAPSVQTSGSRASAVRSGPKTEKDLPPDVMTAAKDFLKRGRITSLKEYADIYWQEMGE